MLFGLQLDYFSIGIPAILVLSILFSFLSFAFGWICNKNRINQDSVGSYFGVIGTLFAVLIGLVIFDVASKYADAHENIVSESKAIAEISVYLKQFKTGGVGSELNGLLLDYLDEMISSDWEHLERDQYNPKARAIISKIMVRIGAIVPTEKNEEIYLPILVQSVTNMAESRMIRFDIATHYMPTCEWALLISSGLLTILSSFYVRVGSSYAQIFLSFILSFSILTSLYAVLMFSEPYKGSFRVSINPLLHTQKVLHGEFGEY